jgi:hypothetical protein
MNRRPWRSRPSISRRWPKTKNLGPSRRRSGQIHRHRSVQGALQPDAARTGDALGADIAALETALATLRKRYEYHQLQARKTAIEAEAAPSSTAEDSDQTPPTVEEVKALQARLEQLEEELADVDLSWGVWVEPFWQAVRFGGVGIIIGWILRAIAHGN